ncbi:unnamed protein product [Brachionus calyciflorus]|uniref:Uncharacterized protein n=1 Tax=Brachionus calyciflorus TaxID=104777 RepID=A0A813MRJ5_9BILA|nr:unnamed protein product [Brachionus calyciflorus]
MRTNIDLYTETILCLKQIVDATVALMLNEYTRQAVCAEVTIANSTVKPIVKKIIPKQKNKYSKCSAFRLSDEFYGKFFTSRFNYIIKPKSTKRLINKIKPIKIHFINSNCFFLDTKMIFPNKREFIDLHSNWKISGIFRLYLLDLIRLYLFYIFYLQMKKRILKDNEKIKETVILPLYKINLQIPFIFLNQIEIDQSLLPTEPKEIEFDSEKKEEILNQIQESFGEKEEKKLVSQIADENCDFVFKVPFSVIEPTQDFLPIESAQSSSNITESDYDLIKTQVLSQTIKEQSEHIYEMNFVETQILEQSDKVNIPKIEDFPISKQQKHLKLEKQKSTEKIKERIFMNFNPFYNSVNSPAFQPTIYSSQFGPTQVYNSRLATQATQNIEQIQPKTIRKRSFMKIGLSKKQKIKKHLHDI